MNDAYDEDGETAYMKMGWDHNVWNCNIPTERSIMICDDRFQSDYLILEAGIILGDLGFSSSQAEMHSCGKWHWFEFVDKETAMAFKLKWS